MKKIFIISAVLLAVVLLFLGIYNFAFKEDVAVKKQITTEIKNSDIVPAALEKITVISDGAVLGPVVDKKTEKIKYYDADTGFVWEMESDGKGKRKISDTRLTGLKNVLWSPDNSKVLTTIKKDGKYSFYEYDYLSQKGTALKDGLDTAVWDNIGTKIFYKYFDNVAKERTLNIANPDGSEWQKITDIDIRKIVITPIPFTSFVSFWNFPNANEETKLQMIGVTGGEIKTLVSGKYGADYLWSIKGDKVLVSALASNGSKNITLGVATVNGEYQELGIPTFASKCVWSQDGKTVYYALPLGIPNNAIMPNDYLENKFTTEDTFWKMDITTGEKERIIETTDIKGKYDSSNMFLSATEDALYFVNKIDQKLYRLEF